MAKIMVASENDCCIIDPKRMYHVVFSYVVDTVAHVAFRTCAFVRLHMCECVRTCICECVRAYTRSNARMKICAYII